MKIDLTGTFLVSRATARVMLKQKDGRIINIHPFWELYRPACNARLPRPRRGIVHLTRTLAIELGEHGILVNCVAPGSTLTEGTKQLFYSENAAEKDRAKRVLSHIPLGRAGYGRGNGACRAVFCRARKWIHHGADSVRRWWLERGRILPRFLGEHPSL